MKLRIKGNSVRLRVGRTELARFLKDGRIDETICFGPAPEANLTYALEVQSGLTETRVRYTPRELTVTLTLDQVRRWSDEDQVGVYTAVPIGPQNTLEVIVEKDFACLDRSDQDNRDTFANPHLAPSCQVG